MGTHVAKHVLSPMRRNWGGKGKQTTGNENKNMNQNETRPRGGVKREREDAPCKRGRVANGWSDVNDMARFFVLQPILSSSLLSDGTRSFSCLACKRRELCGR